MCFLHFDTCPYPACRNTEFQLQRLYIKGTRTGFHVKAKQSVCFPFCMSRKIFFVTGFIQP